MAYAANAAQAGLDGVVCSPMEAGKVHEACGRNFVTVTPGIRFRRETRGTGPCDNTGPRQRTLVPIILWWAVPLPLRQTRWPPMSVA